MTSKEWDDRDPLIILLERESKSCKGCKHEQFYTGWDLAIWICTTKDKNDKRRHHGRRCDQYSTREV
jgi:hypothetical protein